MSSPGRDTPRTPSSSSWLGRFVGYGSGSRPPARDSSVETGSEGTTGQRPHPGVTPVPRVHNLRLKSPTLSPQRSETQRGRGMSETTPNGVGGRFPLTSAAAAAAAAADGAAFGGLEGAMVVRADLAATRNATVSPWRSQAMNGSIRPSGYRARNSAARTENDRPEQLSSANAGSSVGTALSRRIVRTKKSWRSRSKIFTAGRTREKKSAERARVSERLREASTHPEFSRQSVEGRRHFSARGGQILTGSGQPYPNRLQSSCRKRTRHLFDGDADADADGGEKSSAEGFRDSKRSRVVRFQDTEAEGGADAVREYWVGDNRKATPFQSRSPGTANSSLTVKASGDSPAPSQVEAETPRVVIPTLGPFSFTDVEAEDGVPEDLATESKGLRCDYEIAKPNYGSDQFPQDAFILDAETVATEQELQSLLVEAGDGGSEKKREKEECEGESWTCKHCGTLNAHDDSICTKCNKRLYETSTGSWGKVFAHLKTNGWQCPRCLIMNSESLTACPACEKERPRAVDETATTNTTTTADISRNASSASSTAAFSGSIGKGGFSFSTKSTSPTTPAVGIGPKGFSFGADPKSLNTVGNSQPASTNTANAVNTLGQPLSSDANKPASKPVNITFGGITPVSTPASTVKTASTPFTVGGKTPKNGSTPRFGDGENGDAPKTQMSSSTAFDMQPDGNPTPVGPSPAPRPGVTGHPVFVVPKAVAAPTTTTPQPGKETTTAPPASASGFSLGDSSQKGPIFGITPSAPVAKQDSDGSLKKKRRSEEAPPPFGSSSLAGQGPTPAATATASGTTPAGQSASKASVFAAAAPSAFALEAAPTSTVPTNALEAHAATTTNVAPNSSSTKAPLQAFGAASKPTSAPPPPGNTPQQASFGSQTFGKAPSVSPGPGMAPTGATASAAFPFQFGAASKVPNSSSTPAPFVFGAASNQSQAQQQSGGSGLERQPQPFQFGASNQAQMQQPSVGIDPQKQAKPPIQFGAPASQQASQPATAPTFGTTTPGANSNTPSNMFGGAPVSSGFIFGSAGAPQAPPSAATTGSGFGGSMPPPQQNFFGVNGGTAGGGFTGFGASAVQQPPATAAPASFGAASGAFGAGAPTQPMQPPGGFGGGSAAPVPSGGAVDGGFQLGLPTQRKGRRIVRARRPVNRQA